MFRRRPARLSLNRARLSVNHSWLTLLVGSSVVMFPLLLIAGLQVTSTGQERWIPFSLHSETNADYSVTSQKWSAPPADSGIIQDALADLREGGPQAVSTLFALLETPFSTVPSGFTAQDQTPEPTSPPVFTLPVITGLPATQRPPTRSATPTGTPTLTATATQPRISPPTATGTAPKPRPSKTRPPTETFAPPPPQPTDTRPAPTPTSPPTPKPTATPLPYP